MQVKRQPFDLLTGTWQVQKLCFDTHLPLTLVLLMRLAETHPAQWGCSHLGLPFFRETQFIAVSSMELGCSQTAILGEKKRYECCHISPLVWHNYAIIIPTLRVAMYSLEYVLLFYITLFFCLAKHKWRQHLSSQVSYPLLGSMNLNQETWVRGYTQQYTTLWAAACKLMANISGRKQLGMRLLTLKAKVLATLSIVSYSCGLGMRLHSALHNALSCSMQACGRFSHCRILHCVTGRYCRWWKTGWEPASSYISVTYCVYMFGTTV